MFAVITINYNLHNHTIDCVNSILRSDYNELKIFLVDNGSKQEDYNALQQAFIDNPKVNILRIETNTGYVGGVNFGLEKASRENPDYFLVMNNDTIIDEFAISALVSTAERHNDNAIISGKVCYFDQPDVIQHTGVIFTDKRYLTTYYPGRNEKDTGQCDTEEERDSLDDVFWLIPRKVFFETGYYCNYFYLYAEQGDYAWRARQKGFKLIYTPKAKLWHKESMTAGKGNPKSLAICYWRGQGIFISQYLHLRKKYFMLLVIRNMAKLAAKSVVTHRETRRCSFALLRGYLYGFRWMFNKRPNRGLNPYIKDRGKS
ncbi:MAG: glycosyltransferase family 2 protein [Bacteroidales bacterium]|nr:glycosyltransferase family 2 protein [Bacteroidales bacterium]